MPDLILQSLPYSRDSRHLMERLGVLSHPVFLDSGLSDAAEARYDILSAAPTVFRVLRRQSSDQLFKQLHDELTGERPDPGVCDQLSHLPFCGGLLGCLSYDIGVPGSEAASGAAGHRSVISDMPALKPLSDLPLAAVGRYDWAVIVDHQRQQSVFFILPQCPDEIRRAVLAQLSPTLQAMDDPEPFCLHAGFSALDNVDSYKSAFTRLQDYILSGDCYQANLAMAFTAGYSGSVLEAFLHLRQRSRSPFSAFYDAGSFQLLSLSPERFLSVKDRRVFTQPIKGTRKRFADPVQDQASIDELLGSEKDRAENLMIVDLLRNDLGAVCETGSVKTESLFALHSFSQVHHLISSISALLPADSSPLALLARCFPGGSITGAPKIRAMQIIAELEHVPRAFYCGSVFYSDYLDRMDSNICIRTLVAAGNRLYCWGGSGVVADSCVDLEYQECLDKVSVLMDLPGA